MEFVNMILHLVINCDSCIDHQIHTYLIMTCRNDISVKSDLKSKRISNDQELIQSDPISCPQNQKENN